MMLQSLSKIGTKDSLRRNVVCSGSFGSCLSSNIAKSVRCMSFNSGTNVNYIEEMYKSWKQDPSSVHKSWDTIFKSSSSNFGDVYTSPSLLSNSQLKFSGLSSQEMKSSETNDYINLYSLIRAYQSYGHLDAKLDPLGMLDVHLNPDKPEELCPEYYGLNDKLEKEYILPKDTFYFSTGNPMKLKDIIQRLNNIYSGSIGVEYMHILNKEAREWVHKTVETERPFHITKVEQLLLYERLARSTLFERYLAKKFSSEKRFGLEGLEMMIPSLKTIIDEFSEHGTNHVFMGTAHRGRLNILANVFRTSLVDILSRFNNELNQECFGSGDVKYHLGMLNTRVNRKTGKKIKMCIVANPSHLETVNPVVQGKARGEMHKLKDKHGDQVATILIHGDAAFAGQGVVYESIQLSKLNGYTTNGIIHIVANNQIGFTTDTCDSRSSNYASDVAKILDSPIFHVNADDPEAVYYVSKMAARFRNKFKKDVFIDLIGYRRNGHNEADNPSFTQPLMYRCISKTEPVFEKYGKELVEKKIISASVIEQLVSHYGSILDDGMQAAQNAAEISNRVWIDSPMSDLDAESNGPKMASTGYDKNKLIELNTKCNTLPENFEPHPAFNRIVKQRGKMINENLVDWSIGETSAFSTLLTDGVHVRLSGQDCQRGTFSHRHHVIHSLKSDQTKYVPLNNLSPDQANYDVFNSSLSEYAVLGYELGYSLASSKQLVLWEAQFGDFCNTAQCVIDQCLCSGNSKWLRQSGLVMLLPHGYDGMGPEHSSARLERFLQLSSEDPDTFPSYDKDSFHVMQLYDNNWAVVNCTTPANFFHVLRRQLACNFRRPLIVMSPKNLLRHADARSSFDEMDIGTEFQRVIPDNGAASENTENVRKHVFCSGKIYYELLESREKKSLVDQVSITRLEQISPFPFDLVKAECEKYENAELLWVQEEPKNQGAWSYVQPRLKTTLQFNPKDVTYVGREVSASTATGNKKTHYEEQKSIMEAIFDF